MPGPKAPQISLSPDERQGLAGLIRAHKTPQHLSFRAQIILQLADGQNTREVADGLRACKNRISRFAVSGHRTRACSRRGRMV